MINDSICGSMSSHENNNCSCDVEFKNEETNESEEGNEGRKFQFLSNIDSGQYSALSVKDEIIRLLEKVKKMEDEINELRSSLPQKCPHCEARAIPIFRSYYDLFGESKIDGIKRKYKLCPCCKYIYLQYDN